VGREVPGGVFERAGSSPEESRGKVVEEEDVEDGRGP
jgi:hypothetical protein